MRNLILLGAASALAACSTQPDNMSAANSAASTQLNAMDVQANDDVPAVPVENQTAGLTANVVDTPAADIAFAPKVGDESQAGALAVVTHYFAWVSAKNYAGAAKLWDAGSAPAAASFAKYTRYVGTAGTPGDVDPGAGQRYIQIPVKVAATTTEGKKLNASGNVILHMTGQIDGATAEQRSWHIQSVQLDPAL